MTTSPIPRNEVGNVESTARGRRHLARTRGSRARDLHKRAGYDGHVTLGKSTEDSRPQLVLALLVELDVKVRGPRTRVHGGSILEQLCGIL